MLTTAFIKKIKSVQAFLTQDEKKIFVATLTEIPCPEGWYTTLTSINGQFVQKKNHEKITAEEKKELNVFTLNEIGSF